MTSYNIVELSLTDSQKQKVANAVQNLTKTTIQIAPGQIGGEDRLPLTKTQIGKLEKGKAANITLSIAQIRKMRSDIKTGGSIFSSLLPAITKAIPAITKVAAPLATGVLQALGSFSMDKVLGSGMNKHSCCYIIPNETLTDIEEYQDQLTSEQRKHLNEAKQTGSGLVIDPTREQRGGFLGTLLGAVGIPLLLKAITGSGLQNRPPRGSGLQNRPYRGNYYEGMGVNKKKKVQRGEGLLLGKNSPFKSIPILGSIF